MYISREKLLAFPLRRNGEHCDIEHANPHFLNGIETAMEYAETLPSEDVAPVVHGQWEWSHFGCGHAAAYRCTACNKTTEGNWHNYCPNCGAKMDQP